MVFWFFTVSHSSQVSVPSGSKPPWLRADTRYITGILMDYDGGDHQQLARVVRSVLAGHQDFRPDDRRAVFIADFKQDFDEFTIVTTARKVLLAFIGALTLGIGGFGLMNIILVSVQLRTR